MSDFVDIVFDGPPGPVSGRFIEVEDAKGRSVRFGEWIERGEGQWVTADFEKMRVIDVDEVDAALQRAAERVRREGPGDGRMQ
jgi:hypothetical protein